MSSLNGRRTVLVVAPELPFPLRNGGKIRTAQLLRQLARQYHVKLVCYAASPSTVRPDVWPNVELHAIPRPSRRQRLPVLLRGLLRGLPYHFAVQQSPALARCVAEAMPGSDLVVIEHLCMFPTVEYSSQSGMCPIILDLHNVESYRAWNAVRRSDGWSLNPIDWMHWLATPAYERRALQQAQCCFVVSEEERRRVQAMAPAVRVELIPNGVDTDFFSRRPNSRLAARAPVLLFVGSLNYRPNVEAVAFFSTSVLPQIRQSLPAAEFWVVGQKPVTELKLAAQRGRFKLFADVDDVRPYYADCDVVVAPLFSGGGTRLKILEAMAMGKPVVATALGAEGIDLGDGDGIAIANTSAEIAAKCLAWINDCKKSKHEVARRQRNAAEKYSWVTIGQQANAICSGLLSVSG